MEDPETKVVWITMLAMADRRGRVFASIPGLAKDAVVSVDATRRAITSFLAPDPDSRTKDYEGRRIEEIDGGWRLLNHAKYRAIRDEEERRAYKTEKQRQYRAQTVDNCGQCGQMLNAVDSGGHNAEAEAEAEAELKTKTLASSDPSLSAIGSLPCLKGSWFFTQQDVDDWKEAYPAIDVIVELRKDREWLKANPEHRKTFKGMRRHVNSWLARAQNNARSNGGFNGHREGWYESVHRQILEADTGEDSSK